MSRSILPEFAGFLALLFQAIALSAKGLFFTIQKISSDKIFLNVRLVSGDIADGRQLNEQ